MLRNLMTFAAAGAILWAATPGALGLRGRCLHNHRRRTGRMCSAGGVPNSIARSRQEGHFKVSQAGLWPLAGGRSSGAKRR